MDVQGTADKINVSQFLEPIIKERINIMSMKEAYTEKLQARLNEMDAEIEKLKAKAGTARADAKIEIEKQISEVEEAQSKAQAKLDELRASGDDAWTDMKAGVENAWDEFEESTQKALSRFAA